MSMMIQPSRFEVSGGGPGGSGYRVYRIDISANNGDSLVGLDELYAADSVGGADRLRLSGGSGGSFSANSTFYPAAQAFDHISSYRPTGWVSGGGTSGWLRYNAPAPIELTYFGLRTMLTETTRMPKDFKLRYSDDAFAWSDALTFTGLSAWSADEWRFWRVPEGLGAHQYWEYNVSLNQGDSYVSVGDCYMIKSDGDIARNTANNCGLRRSSVFDGGYDLMKALDRNTGAWWATSAGPPQWIEFVCGFDVAEFRFKCKEPNRMPRAFTLSGWNFDTSSWDLLNSYSGQTGWTIGETRAYVV